MPYGGLGGGGSGTVTIITATSANAGLSVVVTNPTINANLAFTLASQPYCAILMSANQTINYNTVTVLNLNSALADPNGIFNTTTHRLIPGAAAGGVANLGVYAVNINLTRDVSVLPNEWHIYFYKNGILYLTFNAATNEDGSAYLTGIGQGIATGPFYIPFTAITDYVEIRVEQFKSGSGTDLVLKDHTNFSAVRVSI